MGEIFLYHIISSPVLVKVLLIIIPDCQDTDKLFDAPALFDYGRDINALSHYTKENSVCAAWIKSTAVGHHLQSFKILSQPNH